MLLIVFFPLVGSILWLVAGRPEGGPARSAAYERAAPGFPEYDRPGRAAAADPERDADFLRQVGERTEAQRRRYEQQRARDREQEEERRQQPQPEPEE